MQINNGSILKDMRNPVVLEQGTVSQTSFADRSDYWQSYYGRDQRIRDQTPSHHMTLLVHIHMQRLWRAKRRIIRWSLILGVETVGTRSFLPGTVILRLGLTNLSAESLRRARKYRAGFAKRIFICSFA